MQAASDIFLGWASAGDTDYYVRQLRDMKGTVNTASLGPRGLVGYAKLCGWALARAHARSGAAAQIAGYAGNGGVLDDAITHGSPLAYADQTERDHALLVEAVRTGSDRRHPGGLRARSSRVRRLDGRAGSFTSRRVDLRPSRPSSSSQSAAATLAWTCSARGGPGDDRRHRAVRRDPGDGELDHASGSGARRTR